MARSAEISASRSFPPVFRVYEHELLRVGDAVGGEAFSVKQLEALVRLAQQTGNRYFTPGHQSIRFKHFVGILATPMLVVEILPKADRRQKRPLPSWQGILIDMLRACRFVRPESTGRAALGNRPGDLLDWYIRIFVDELKGLLRSGLVHTYTARQENLGVLKGRLQFAQQLKHNYIRKERFFVQYDQFTDRHPANLLIGAALQRLRYLSLAPDLEAELGRLLHAFPQPGKEISVGISAQNPIFSDRKLDRYAQPLKIAQHILQQQLPDIRAGEHDGLALLFDMNLLFEEYLYRQLLRWKPPGVQVERQQSQVFWGQNRLRPDLVLSSTQGRWVLDTKWRILHTRQPTADELRQIYVYCDYFQADQGVLIFPRTDAVSQPQMRAFAPLPGLQNQNRSCQLYFARVLTEQGVLNQELGKELFHALGVI